MFEYFTLTDGEYAAYRIVAIFSDRTLAQKFVAEIGGDKFEEWILNDTDWRSGQGLYDFTFNQAGDIVKETLEARINRRRTSLRVPLGSSRRAYSPSRQG